MHNMTQNWENKSKHRQKNTVIYVPNTFFTSNSDVLVCFHAAEQDDKK